jgi:hypothetical protein
MCHAKGRTDVHTKFGWENLKGRNHIEYLGIQVRKILKLILKIWVQMVWTEFIGLG